GAAGTASAQAGDNAPENVLILGVSGSPRKGKTTATAMAAALEAAKGVDPRITTELIDLGGLKIAGSDGSSSSAPGGVADDFEQFLPLLKSQYLGGMMIGSPSYFRSMSSLCKAFLERLAVLRDPSLQLADLPVGALSVGSYRNGGQELVIEQILTVMLCHEAMLVGGKPKAHQGATLWNAHKDDITQDEFGMESARNLGIRVAEAALKHKGLK
ncbi:MAG: flavodoxin family protein, partial [Candidatus Hydrogenedens sp.]|nr:flavodoxin family protein [Candidatus Hydrogenedens sp.]